MRDDRQDRFKKRYRVDVPAHRRHQFLEGQDQTQEEFFHLQHLHNANKQIIDLRPAAPKKLDEFEDRLRNRFEWGLVTDVQPPDLRTRIMILRKKASGPAHRADRRPEFIASKIPDQHPRAQER
ncbi:MAG: DnaA/Hda family protein [Nocardioides sp.]